MQKYIIGALLYSAVCFGGQAESYVVRLLSEAQVRLEQENTVLMQRYEDGITNMNASVSLCADAMNTNRQELHSLTVLKMHLQALCDQKFQLGENLQCVLKDKDALLYHIMHIAKQGVKEVEVRAALSQVHHCDDHLQNIKTQLAEIKALKRAAYASIFTERAKAKVSDADVSTQEQ
jgi:hypothetical protein